MYMIGSFGVSQNFQLYCQLIDNAWDYQNSKTAE